MERSKKFKKFGDRTAKGDEKKKLRAQKKLGGAAALLLLCTSCHWSHYVNGSGEERSYYKRYANLLTKIKSAAKKFYYGTQLKLHSNNPAKMWKTLRELLLSKKQHSDVPISIKINDAIFSDLEQVTHAFKEFFVNVGSDSAQNTSSNYSHTHFLRNRVFSSIVLFSPSPQEVASELKRLTTNKSSGDDQIPLSFITIAAHVISPYL